MAFPSKLKDLCTPAFIYFVLSMISVCCQDNLHSVLDMDIELDLQRWSH